MTTLQIEDYVSLVCLISYIERCAKLTNDPRVVANFAKHHIGNWLQSRYPDFTWESYDERIEELIRVAKND